MGLLRVIKLFPGQSSQLEPNHKPHQVHTLLVETFCTSETRRIFSSRLCNHHSAVGILLEENSSSASSQQWAERCRNSIFAPQLIYQKGTSKALLEPDRFHVEWFGLLFWVFFFPSKSHWTLSTVFPQHQQLFTRRFLPFLLLSFSRKEALFGVRDDLHEPRGYLERGLSS